LDRQSEEKKKREREKEERLSLNTLVSKKRSNSCFPFYTGGPSYSISKRGRVVGKKLLISQRIKGEKGDLCWFYGGEKGGKSPFGLGRSGGDLWIPLALGSTHWGGDPLADYECWEKKKKNPPYSRKLSKRVEKVFHPTIHRRREMTKLQLLHTRQKKGEGGYICYEIALPEDSMEDESGKKRGGAWFACHRYMIEKGEK